MKAKIESELEFDKDVVKTLKEDGLNEKEINEQLKEQLEQNLFEACEDWVLRGQRPNIEFV